MNGLPKGLDLSFFVGKTLWTVTFGAFTIHLGFEHDIVISVKTTFQHQQKADLDEGRTGILQSLPLTHSSLMSLLGLEVSEVLGDEKGTLSLTFSDGQVLRVFDDDPGYESYSFSDGEHEYFV